MLTRSPQLRSPSAQAELAIGLANLQSVATATYDFARHGGAVSTIGLSGKTIIPSGAVVQGGYVDITTPLTSGGAATIAAQINAANDLLTAVAVASWAAGRFNVLPAPTTGALTASTAVKTTAARDISVVIAVAALTAGVAEFVVFYTDPTVASV